MAMNRNLYGKTPIRDFYLDLAKFPAGKDLSIDGRNLIDHVVTPRQQYRPDLLSYDLYGSSSYWWTIVMLNRNAIKDPIRDLKTGTLIKVISPATITGVS